jgi:hypothetical protein
LSYVIIPGCTGPNGETLALSAADDGSVTVEDASEITVNLLWSLVYDVPSGDFAMVSQNSVENGTPGVLSLVSQGGTTTPLQVTSYDGGLSPAMLWDVTSGGDALAVRPSQFTSLNLNVAGNGPYTPGTPVIAYDGWGNGQPNEVWTFKQVGLGNFPWNYTFSPECALGLLLTANAQDAGGQLTLQVPQGDESAGPLQLWSGRFFIDGTTPHGAIFVNEELSMTLRTTPNGGAVFCADPADWDSWSSWRVGGAPDPGMWAVHSGGNDDLTLNVAGVGPYDAGSAVITYPWQGGEQNEQWRVTFVPHEVT